MRISDWSSDVCSADLAATKQVSDSIATVNQRRKTPIHVVGLVPNRVRANDTHQMKMLAAIKEKIGRNLFTNFLPERAHYSQAMQEHVPVWRFDKDVRTSLPPMRAFLEEAMTRIGSHK